MRTEALAPGTLLMLRPSMLATAKVFLLCGAFLAAGIGLILEGARIGWLAVVFFGAGTVAAVVRLLPNSAYLRLDPQGLTLRSFYRDLTLRWTDIERFEVLQLGAKRMVGLKYAPHRQRRERLAGMARRLSGYDAAFPDTYGMSPEELTVLLSDWKARYGPS